MDTGGAWGNWDWGLLVGFGGIEIWGYQWDVGLLTLVRCGLKGGGYWAVGSVQGWGNGAQGGWPAGLLGGVQQDRVGWGSMGVVRDGSAVPQLLQVVIP